MYYYSRRRDKQGNTLMTSYTTEKSADSYGAGGEICEAVYRLNEEGTQISKDFKEGHIVRSVMINNGSVLEADESTEHDFVLWERKDGVWYTTPNSYVGYGDANKAMKELNKYHEGLVIVDNSARAKSSRPITGYEF